MANIRPLTNLLGDVRRTNNFIVTISDVTAVISPDGTQTDIGTSSLELVIQQAFLPSVSLNVLELRHGNDAKKFAGVATWNGGQITIIDVLNKDELQAVLAWFKKTYNWKTGEIGLASEYKKAGYITEYASDGRYERRWEVEGMWISSLNVGDLDATSGEMKKVTMTIEIDPSTKFAPTYSDSENETYNVDKNPLNQ